MLRLSVSKGHTKMMMAKLTAILFISLTFLAASKANQQPNIIIVLADDFGWNDIGYHNPEVISPNLDQLAREGVILDRNYAQAVCTPSRASLMTGMYPYKIGRQGQLPIGENIPTGLTLDYKLLPQYLKEFGYATHLVGKWHLGFCKPDYLPLNRGFDTFFGFWSGYEDYFDNTLPIQYLHLHDFFDNEEVYFNDGTYSTVNLILPFEFKNTKIAFSYRISTRIKPWKSSKIITLLFHFSCTLLCKVYMILYKHQK